MKIKNIRTYRPTITIVTVTYNAYDNIDKTINSVINQDYDKMEYILIDGMSNDGTQSVINKYRCKFSHLIIEPDNGIYDAMNKGIKLAIGDWIIFMNAGDVFYNKNVLSNIFTSIDMDDVDVICGKTLATYRWGDIILGPREFSRNDSNLPFCHQSTIVRTDIMKKKYFNLQYKIASDYDFFYSLFIDGYKFQYINNIISVYDTEGLSANHVNTAYKEISSITKRNGLYSNLFLLYLNFRMISLKCLPSFFISFLRRKQFQKQLKQSDFKNY